MTINTRETWLALHHIKVPHDMKRDDYHALFGRVYDAARAAGGSADSAVTFWDTGEMVPTAIVVRLPRKVDAGALLDPFGLRHLSMGNTRDTRPV